ncbi:MAG: hypothetical protein ACRD2M_07565 [Terriglobales bacterium]
MAQSKRKCLIVERHQWETGGGEQQLQFVLATAKSFFGSGTRDRTIQVRVFMNPVSNTPSFTKDIVISREYRNGTRRTNGFREMGSVPSSFIFFEETSNAGVYDVWWLVDKVPIAARYYGWTRGKDTQYGRGRYSLIVNAPAPRSA